MGHPGSRRARLGIVLLAGFSLVAAACGGSSGSDTATEQTVDENVRGAVQDQLNSDTSEGDSATTAAPASTATNIEELEAEWAADREAIVKKLVDGGYGVDEATKMLKGPDGLEVDLSKCPSDWSETAGLTDTEIKIGQTLAQSGTLADYGNQTKAWNVYIDYVNEEFGGITDSEGKTRKVTLVSKDDAYDPTKTIPLVDELLDNDNVFAIHTGGSGNTLRVYDRTNNSCVPHPFVWTGHPAWGDPIDHPWTMGSILAYNTEAILWGSYIEKNLPKGVTVAAAVINNDFGKAYELGFKAFLDQSDHDIRFVSQLFEPTAPTITIEMTTLAAENPDVFIAMTAGVTCTQAIIEAAQNGIAETAQQLWMPSVCKALSFVGEEAVGEQSDGYLVVGGGVIDLNDPAFADKPSIEWARQLLEDAGIDPKSSSNLSAGFYLGWPWIETLRIAAALPGGLTRSNMMLAMRSLDLQNPFMLDGIRMLTSGAKQVYPVEGSEFARFDAAEQTWKVEGDIINLAGKSAPCSWDQSVGNCK